MKYGDEVLNELKEVRVKVEKRLVLTDAIAEEFDKQLAGAKAGEQRTVKITLSRNAANSLLRGKTIDATFKILDIKATRIPDMTPETVREIFGFDSEEQLDEAVRAALDRKLEYEQRQTARQQILEQLAEAQNLELPAEMLRKQATRALQRRVMQMRNAGLSDDQIRSRSRLLQQDALESTAASMKEHFVLQKIAELEKIEIDDDDIDAEIDQIAARSDESPRKVRARLEKEDLIETLATELLERRALDLVLESAEYEEYDWSQDEDEGEAAAIEAQAIPGTAEDEEPEIPEEAASSEETKS
jgi:trigger factor